MDITLNIDPDFLSKIFEMAGKYDIDYDCYEGCLQDNFIFYNTRPIKIDGKSRDFIIVKERFLNEWSSDLILIMTNSIEEVENFEMTFRAA